MVRRSRKVTSWTSSPCVMCLTSEAAQQRGQVEQRHVHLAGQHARCARAHGQCLVGAAAAVTPALDDDVGLVHSSPTRRAAQVGHHRRRCPGPGRLAAQQRRRGRAPAPAVPASAVTPRSAGSSDGHRATARPARAPRSPSRARGPPGGPGPDQQERPARAAHRSRTAAELRVHLRRDLRHAAGRGRRRPPARAAAGMPSIVADSRDPARCRCRPRRGCAGARPPHPARAR